MLKKLIFIAVTSLSLGSTNVLAQQTEQLQQQPRSQATHNERTEQVQLSAAQMDPYMYCYIAGKAYTEGIILDGAGKCQSSVVADSKGRKKMYWEAEFYKQR